MADSLAPGQEKEQALRGAGFNDEQVNAWKSRTAQALQDGGFDDDKIKGYFGVKEPDTSAMKDYVNKNLQEFKESQKNADGSVKHEATGFLEALDAGWQSSVTGLGIRGKMPDTIMPEHAGMAMRIAQNVSQLAGDLPAMVAGGFAGSMGGAVAGGAAGSVVPVVGTLGGIAAGSIAGAGFGTFAAPAAMRRILMDHYEKGDIQSAGDFMERLSGVTMEALKSGTVGALTSGAGALAKPIAGAMGGLGAELATMTTASAAMQGHLPEAQDFVDGAILIGGMHVAGGALPGKLREIYAKTGQKPEEIAQAAQTDPVLKTELASDNDNLPSQAAKPEAVIEKEAPPAVKEGEAPELTAAKNNVLSRLGENAEPETAPWWSKQGRAELWDKAYTALVDRFSPISEAVKASDLTLEEKNNPYLLIRNFPGWKGKAEHFMKFGTLDFNTGQMNGESLEKILGDVPKDEQNDFKAYGLAKRALERADYSKETGIKKEDAQTVVDAFKDKHEATFQRLVDYNNRVMQYAVDSGLLGKENQTRILNDSKDYFPLARTQDIDEWTGEIERGNGAQLYQEMEGSKKKILDPIEQIMRNTMRVVKAADLNNVSKAFVDMAEQSEFGGGILEKIEKPTGADNEITYKEGGESQTFKTRPEYAEAIKSLNADPGKTALWMKMLQAPAGWLRTGTVLNPDFILRHGERSLFISAAQSKFAGIADIPKTFAQNLMAIGDIWKESKAYQEYLSSGGAQSSLTGLDHYMKDQSVWDLNKETGNFLSKAWNSFLSPLEYMAHVSDNMARVAEFKRAGGVEGDLNTKIGAGFAAREATLDYLRAGAQVKAMSSFVPFMNIGIQGTDRLARAWAADPLGFSARAAAALTVPTVINWAVNRNDSRYQDAPNWEKDLYWIIPTNKWEKAANIADAMSRPEDLKRQAADGSWEVNNGTTLRIAKPFELGVLFASGPERVLNSFFDQNPRAFKEFEQTLLHGIIPNVLPTALTPVLEQGTNKNFFTGRPVVSSHAESLLPEYQYNEYTSTTAKQLGKLIGYVPGLRDLGPKDAKLASPMVIDNYIRDWTGTMGNYALQIASGASKMAGAENNVPTPSMALSDMPIIKAFIVRNPSQNMQPIQDFYDDYEKASRVLATAKDLAKAGNSDSATQVMAENQGNMAKLTGIHQAIGVQAKFLKFVNSSPDYSASDKRQLMDAAYYQMSAIAKEGNRILDERRKNLNAQH